MTHHQFTPEQRSQARDIAEPDIDAAAVRRHRRRRTLPAAMMSLALVTGAGMIAAVNLGGDTAAVRAGEGGGQMVITDGAGSPSRTVGPTAELMATTPMGVGMFTGNFSYETFRSNFGSYPDVETTYLKSDQATTPNLAKHKAEIDRGISPIIDLITINGPYSRAQIAAWGPGVQSYYQTFVAGLKTISDYATKADNGARVYFADEHEAQVKINQHRYAAKLGAQPTTEQSAAAWNKIMTYVKSVAPNVVRTYWYGGSGKNEDVYASRLTPSLIQAASFDPYRWRHNTSSDTPQELWGSAVTKLKAASWMRNADGSLKPWGLTEWGTDVSLGDGANATFVTAAISYLRNQGAAFANYFNRQDGLDSSNSFLMTSGKQPKTLAAFKAAVR